MGVDEEVPVSGLVATLERQAEEAERRASGLRKLIEVANDLGEDGVKELLALVANGNGSGTPKREPQRFVAGFGLSDEDEAPRGREAVRRIVRARPGVWTLRALRTEMESLGSFTSTKALEVAVARLVKSGEARRVGKGRYVFLAVGEMSQP